MTYEHLQGHSQHYNEEDTIAAIRTVLTEDVAQPSSAPVYSAPTRETDPTPHRAADGRAFVDRTPDPALHRRATDLPDLHPTVPDDSRAPKEHSKTGQPSVLRTRLLHAVSTIRNFRPVTGHVVLVSIALLIVMRPHWFVISSVLALALVTGSFLLAGPERVWRLVLIWLARVDTRDPERAARLRARLDRFACRWDAILDRFPDGSVDALYMPDLQGMQDADTLHTRVMAERLQRMAQDT